MMSRGYLYFLLPFCIFLPEKRFRVYNENDTQCRKAGALFEEQINGGNTYDVSFSYIG